MQMSGYIFLLKLEKSCEKNMKCENIKGWRKLNGVITKILFSQTLPGKIFGTKYINPVKLNKTRKPLYLLLRTF